MTIQVNKIYSYQTLVYKNGNRTFRKAKYTKYIDEIRQQLDDSTFDGDVEVWITFYNKNKVLGDLDNITKPILDTLQEHGTIKNDRQITKLHIEKVTNHTKTQIMIKIKEIL